MSLARLSARLTRLEVQVHAGSQGQGLASLLAYARRSPAEAFDLDEDLDAATPPRGLARLLWEIRHARGEDSRA